MIFFEKGSNGPDVLFNQPWIFKDFAVDFLKDVFFFFIFYDPCFVNETGAEGEGGATL